MSYKLRRDDGSETQGESPEEAAALMRGLEDAESGVTAEVDRAFAFADRMAAIMREEDADLIHVVRAIKEEQASKRLIRLPNVWPRADPDVVAKTVKDAEDVIGD